MGTALLGGWLERGLNASDITVVDPIEQTVKAVAEGFGVIAVTDVSAIDENFAPMAIVLAVKPQAMDDAAQAYKGFAEGAVFLSIAAGKTIAYFESILGAQAAIVRAMPNTPAAIGRGITVACANDIIDDAGRVLCDGLLGAVGDVAWIDDEGLMDAVTAVSGSGPAYVFLLIEALAAAGADAGLAPDLAMRMAQTTVRGAGELAHRSEDSPRQLRINVTSPGGTTAAALEVLMAEDGLGRLMRRAVDAATRRSKALAG